MFSVFAFFNNLIAKPKANSNIVYIVSLSTSSEKITHLNNTWGNAYEDAIIKHNNTGGQKTTQFVKPFPLSFRSQSGSVSTVQWQDVLHSLSFLPRFGSGLWSDQGFSVSAGPTYDLTCTDEFRSHLTTSYFWMNCCVLIIVFLDGARFLSGLDRSPRSVCDVLPWSVIISFKQRLYNNREASRMITNKPFHFL